MYNIHLHDSLVCILAMRVRCHLPTNMYFCRTSKMENLFPLPSLSVAVQQSSSSTSSRFEHTVLAADTGSPLFRSCWNLSGGRSKQLLTNIPMQIPIKVHSWVRLTRSFCVFNPVSSYLILLAWCSQQVSGRSWVSLGSWRVQRSSVSHCKCPASRVSRPWCCQPEVTK